MVSPYTEEHGNMEFLEQFFQEQSRREKEDKIQRFRRLNQYVKPGQVLFAGSSLMEQFPIYEFLQDFDIPLTIYNRGVGGYTTREMLEVMDVCVYDLKPSHIFLNIGTNDLNDAQLDMDALMGRYGQILEGIRAHLPQAKIHLLAYYPVNPEVGKREPFMAALLQNRTNARIQEANRRVKALASQYGADYLDLNAGLVDGAGNLREEFTIEGMHMYANGYREVLSALLPELLKLKNS